jgi:RHS repeat-associated protein
MAMPGRTFSNSAYRYGFNGKENDNEVKGSGNQQDYGMRIYDTRLGRFLSVDSLTKSYPFYSPYHYAGNGPIKNIDLDGAEPAGNYWDWEVIGHGDVHTTTVIPKTGDAISARAEQIKVKDKNGWTGWITKATYQTVYQGITQKSASYAWFNESKDLGLSAKDNERWMPFETEIQRRSREITELADNTSTAIFGVAAVGAAVPAISALSSTYLGGKFVSTGIDFSAQMLVNGGNLNDINITSLATSFVFNNSSSYKNLFLKNSIANGLQYNSGSGYQGFLGENVSNTNIFYNIAIGTLLDKVTYGLQNLNSGVTPAALGRWKN